MTHESVTPPYERDCCPGCGANVFDGEECICDRIEEPPESEQMFEVPGRKLRLMRDTLEAALHFHATIDWNDDAKAKWFALTDTHECTTRTLCERLRLALGDKS